MIFSLFQSTKASRPVRPRVTRRPLTMEGLEERMVMSAAAAAAPHMPPVQVAPAAMQSPLQITGATVTGLSNIVGNTVTATVNLTGTVLGKAFTLPNLQVPVTFTGITPGTPATTTTPATSPILHLSLQIPDLNVLGLHVRLDNCNNGPVTVDITATPGGGLLGDLLSGGTLNSLTSLISTINPNTGNNVLTDVVGGILGGIVAPTKGGAAGGTGGAGGAGDTIPAGDCELVDLHLNTIHLNLLGLNVDTSPICLNVYADPNGGLLGDLLCSIDNLLNNHGNNGHAQTVLVRNLLRDLQRLGL